MNGQACHTDSDRKKKTRFCRLHDQWILVAFWGIGELNIPLFFFRTLNKDFTSNSTCMVYVCICSVYCPLGDYESKIATPLLGEPPNKSIDTVRALEILLCP